MSNSERQSGIVAFLSARLAEGEQEMLDMLWGETAADNDLTERRGRTLREVEAKRAILDRYLALRSYAARPYDAEDRSPEVIIRRKGYLHALEVVIEGMAAVYSDHPDYSASTEEGR